MAVGFNFVDVYFRTGDYAPPGLPFTLGNEVVAVGEGVGNFAPGDRVAYVETLGAYARKTRPKDASPMFPSTDPFG
jgi:NADPH2:quinone reductase